MGLAKTSRPRLASTVPRPRLSRRLDRARNRPVTWVCGPPGAGKTTVVSDYIASHRLRHLWYQLDSDDADAAAFFYHLCRAAPKRRRLLPLLTPEYRHGLPMFTRRFFRELYARLRVPFALVLDNYQEVSRECGLHDILRDAVEEVPDGGRVICISRGSPPPALARCQVHRRMSFIDGADLRLTGDEATQLVRALKGDEWSREQVRALNESVDGWCAGLVVMLEELTSGHEASHRPHGSSELLFEYFAREIFEKVDSQARDVMLQTALLPRVTPSEADALTLRPGAAQVLIDLHRQNYFTNRRAGDVEPVYEYHPLFRDFLRVEATRSYAPDRYGQIRRSAANLAEASGSVEVAAGLLRDAEDWAALAGLICRHAPIMLGQGRYPTVLDWFAALPDGLIATSPWLLYWRGLCQFGWRSTESKADLERALTAFQQQRDRTGIFAAVSALSFTLVGDGDVAPLDGCAAIIDDLMRESSEFPSQELEGRVASAMMAAILFRQPQRRDAAYWLRRALDLSRVHPDLGWRAVNAAHWFIQHFQLGDLPSAALVTDDMRALMKARNVGPAVTMLASVPVICHEFAFALPTYRRTVTDTLELAQATGMLGYVGKHAVLGLGIFAAVTDQDLEVAERWLDELATDVRTRRPGLLGCWYHMSRGRVALLRGDLMGAEANRQEMIRLTFPGGLLHEAMALVTSADVLHARGQHREAWTDLEGALQIGRQMASPLVEFMGRLTEAHLHLGERRQSEGRTALERAMALGRAGGFVNSYTWRKDVMTRLCAMCLEAGIETEYVRRLVLERQLTVCPPPINIESGSWPLSICTLGRFELRRDGRQVTFAGKVQHKPLALLKALIAMSARDGVREERLIDLLWPDAEGDAGRFALTTTIHRLRRLLGHGEAVRRQGRKVSLEARHCWIDVWALQDLLTRAEAAPGESDALANATEQAVMLYVGPFLDGDDEEPWAEPLNKALRHRLLRQVIRVAEAAERTGDWPRATTSYETGLRIDPCAEDVCRRLMTIYHRAGRRADVDAAYGRCRDALADRLGIAPSPQTISLLNQFRSD